MKIAQALLLRKQLEQKVAQLEPIKKMGEQGLFEVQVKRVNVSDAIDNVEMQVPHVELSDVTAEYDRYASALRKIDESIQQANWAHDVTFTDNDNPFNTPAKKPVKAKK